VEGAICSRIVYPEEGKGLQALLFELTVCWSGRILAVNNVVSKVYRLSANAWATAQLDNAGLPESL